MFLSQADNLHIEMERLSKNLKMMTQKKLRGLELDRLFSLHWKFVIGLVLREQQLTNLSILYSKSINNIPFWCGGALVILHQRVRNGFLTLPIVYNFRHHVWSKNILLVILFCNSTRPSSYLGYGVTIA